jgi:hypothetical protein
MKKYRLKFTFTTYQSFLPQKRKCIEAAHAVEILILKKNEKDVSSAKNMLIHTPYCSSKKQATPARQSAKKKRTASKLLKVFYNASARSKK